MTIRLDDDGRVTEVAFEGKGCAISTAATSLLTDELAGKTREELLRLPKEFVLELLGIEISATRMKCAMLGLKVVKSATPRRARRMGGRGRGRRPGRGRPPISTGQALDRDDSSLSAITAKLAPCGSTEDEQSTGEASSATHALPPHSVA